MINYCGIFGVLFLALILAGGLIHDWILYRRDAAKAVVLLGPTPTTPATRVRGRGNP